MLGIFANSINVATRQEGRREGHNHWGARTQFDDRRRAELIAHTEGRRRD